MAIIVSDVSGSSITTECHMPSEDAHRSGSSQAVKEARETATSGDDTPVKYRHIAAVHSRPRTSCLSHESEASPSFLGFRNLMVIVLGGPNLE